MTNDQKQQMIHRLLDIQAQVTELVRDVFSTLAPAEAPADAVPIIPPESDRHALFRGTLRDPAPLAPVADRFASRGGPMELECGCFGQCKGHDTEKATPGAPINHF